MSITSTPTVRPSPLGHPSVSAWVTTRLIVLAVITGAVVALASGALLVACVVLVGGSLPLPAAMVTAHRARRLEDAVGALAAECRRGATGVRW